MSWKTSVDSNQLDPKAENLDKTLTSAVLSPSKIPFGVDKNRLQSAIDSLQLGKTSK